MILYVGNLPFQTMASDLRELFGGFGKVLRAQLAIDPATGTSRGFGFVELAGDAVGVAEALHGHDWQGRKLTVNLAHPRRRASPPLASRGANR